jgi:hypothetical protein
MLNPDDCESLWREIHERQTRTSRSGDYDAFPELGRRAELEAAQFAELPPPTSAHALNERRVSASTMLAGWGVELTRLTIGSGRM